MKYRPLGQNGPLVSALGLGCMSFGGSYGPATEAESLATLDAAYEAGITFYDTANIYGMGVSEEVLGRWMASRKPQIVLASKSGIDYGPPRQYRNDAPYMRQELEASLRRLGREQLDLYYVHRRDIRVPVEDLVETLGRFIDEGKIAGYGLSEVAPATLRRAHALLPCRAVQNEYSLWTRLPQLGLLQACAELGVAFVPFSPLGRGALTDRPPSPEHLPQTDFRKPNPRFVEPAFSANEGYLAGFRAYAARCGVPSATLAMAWIFDQGEGLFPIPGTRSAVHLAELVAGESLQLTDEMRHEIDRLLPVGFAEGDRYADTQIGGIERYC